MFVESHPKYAAAKWARHLDVSLSGYYSWNDKKNNNKKKWTSTRK